MSHRDEKEPAYNVERALLDDVPSSLNPVEIVTLIVVLLILIIAAFWTLIGVYSLRYYITVR